MKNAKYKSNRSRWSTKMKWESYRKTKRHCPNDVENVTKWRCVNTTKSIIHTQWNARNHSGVNRRHSIQKAILSYARTHSTRTQTVGRAVIAIELLWCTHDDCTYESYHRLMLTALSLHMGIMDLLHCFAFQIHSYKWSLSSEVVASAG